MIIRLLSRFAFFALLAALEFFLGGCETSEVAATNNGAATGSSRFAKAPQDRPGLGTKWGETRTSRVEFSDFVRANPTRPVATASIYYNDAVGIRAMAGAVSPRATWSRARGNGQNFVSVGLANSSGRFLPGLIVGDRWFVVGEEGQRYSIVVRNNTSERLEIVASVDGLDVMDGRPASFSKRGYLMPPHSRRVIDGFRQSTDAVAAFRFSPVRQSYANEKYHNTRNVGVVGIAVFDERGGTDPRLEEETKRRLNATPFAIPVPAKSRH
jgi:hypothetical protein